MNFRPWVVAASAIAVAVAVVWLARPKQDGVAPESAAQPAERAFTSPAETPATPPATPTNVPSIAGAAPDPARSPLPGETVTPIAALLEVAGKDFPDFTENERKFAAEPIDSDWAPRAEAELLGKFARQTGLKLLDLRVHCRSTMCRFQLTLPNDGGGATTPQRFENLDLELTTPQNETFDLHAKWTIFVPDPSGAQNMVGYVPRND